MANVHSKATRSYNNLSRFSGWQLLKTRTLSPKCWCESFYIHTATGTGYTITSNLARCETFRFRQVIGQDFLIIFLRIGHSYQFISTYISPVLLSGNPFLPLSDCVSSNVSQPGI